MRAASMAMLTRVNEILRAASNCRQRGGGGIGSIGGGECVEETELLHLAAAPFPDSAL